MILLLTFLLGLIYYFLNKKLPFPALVFSEMVVMISAISSFLNYGAFQIREIIFYKVFFLVLIFLLDFKKHFRELKNFFRSLNLYALFVIAYLSILVFYSFLVNASFENIGIALYLVSSPLIGYLTAAIFDGHNSKQPRFNIFSLSIYIIPSIILIYLFFTLGLSRLTLGSFALGGFLPSVLFIIIIMRFPETRKHQLFAFFALSILLLEIVLGGSRRYMLPVIIVFFGIFFLWSYRKKYLNLILLASSIFLPIFIFYFYLINDFSMLTLTTNNFDSLNFFRTLGYRSQEVIVLQENLNTPDNILFGYEFGWTLDNTLHGSKGFIDLGPRLHNLYFTLVMNGGLLLLFLFLYPFLKKDIFIGITSLTNSNITFIKKILSLYLISSFVTVAFDSHPDGYWILGWALYYLVSEEKKL